MSEKVTSPIRIPPRERWRQFRIRHLPVLTFAALVIIAVWTWRQFVLPPTIVGEVMPIRASVISAVAGTIDELKVRMLDPVTNGQPLVVVRVFDPDQVEAEIKAIEADLLLMQARMDLDKMRNLDSYSQLCLDLAAEELAFELAKVKLVQAEAEFERAQKLFESGFIARGQGVERNDFGYDIALRDRDALRAEVQVRQKTIADLKLALEKLEVAGVPRIDPQDAAVEKAIAAQQQRIVQLYKPVILKSPIDGFISAIHFFEGQRAPANLPILVVSAKKSDQIQGWIRQPVTYSPAVGDIVEVRSAFPGKPKFTATVVKVGSQFELINPTAFPYAITTQRVEFGLPIVAVVPVGVELIPGEPVQLRLIKPVTSALN